MPIKIKVKEKELLTQRKDIHTEEMAARWMEKSLSSERGHKYRKCPKMSQEGRLGETMGKRKRGRAGGKHSHLAHHLRPTPSPHILS